MNLLESSLRLKGILRLTAQPIAISFSQDYLQDPRRYSDAMPEPTSDGRTGRVSADCVFWMRANEGTFTTVKQNHANCSVGSYTHGLLPLDQAAAKADVAKLLEAEWVNEASFADIEHVAEESSQVTYGPLKDAHKHRDVVFLKVSPVSAMPLHDTILDPEVEGKPQCHIVAIAKEKQQVAISFGCMLSRTRTGMPSSEMTAAIPIALLENALEKLSRTADINQDVASYASVDSRRFMHPRSS